jgi:hypothetical protein
MVSNSLRYSGLKLVHNAESGLVLQATAQNLVLLCGYHILQNGEAKWLKLLTRKHTYLAWEKEKIVFHPMGYGKKWAVNSNILINSIKLKMALVYEFWI